MNTTHTLYLASTSPRRRELIQKLGLPVKIVNNNAEEVIDPSWSPTEAVEQLSMIKAHAAYRNMKATGDLLSGILISADTVVVLEGEILGKPSDAEQAKQMLSSLQGRSHHVLTGFTLIHLQSGETVTSHEQTTVWMKPLQPEQIARYSATGEPMDKAGSYGIQDLGATFIERIEGDYFNVVGLPLSQLADTLGQFGVIVP
ncbi:Maf family protein [Pullulanibacillus sp. KACC 23026]|uniref:Maf family protein n=1 Tax=Pullulanibacillus sp. KACC 23026 TaxID=3028315 RepID=UPI0023AFF278|nr:Maf family protein [Pullulanibacillus sp. KACC 23026]WEG12301.1 Maf family protein [Pullulanibacillus sp. KACC 23026]